MASWTPLQLQELQRQQQLQQLQQQQQLHQEQQLQQQQLLLLQQQQQQQHQLHQQQQQQQFQQLQHQHLLQQQQQQQQQQHQQHQQQQQQQQLLQQQQQQQQQHQPIAAYFHLLPLINAFADAAERGIRDQQVEELVAELINRFERCQEVLNNLSTTLNPSTMTLNSQRQKLEEFESELNYRSELTSKYKCLVEKVAGGAIQL